MTLCFKKPRPINRYEGAYRDSRLFVIATEDKDAPKHYFNNFRNQRIHVEVLSTMDCCSAPKYILERLDQYKETFELGDDDELWLMLDIDHWTEANHIKNFTSICKEAVKKNYQLAHSNPCFEIWLLFHVTDLKSGKQFKTYTEVAKCLKKTLGKYSKRNSDPISFSLEKAAVAVARAEKLDTSSAERWPQKTGSHVYKIVKKLLSS